MKTCKICGRKIKSHNNGLSDLLDNAETKKLLKMKKKDNICIECKFTMMAVDIIIPYYAEKR